MAAMPQQDCEIIFLIVFPQKREAMDPTLRRVLMLC